MHIEYVDSHKKNHEIIQITILLFENVCVRVFEEIIEHAHRQRSIDRNKRY